MAAITWGNDRFVAVGYRGAVTVSTDGSSWTEQSSGTGEYLWDVTWGNGLFVTVGNEGTLLTSPDGMVWTPRTGGTHQALLGVAFGGGTFLACGGEGTILSSTNGIEWTQRTVGSRQWLTSVAWTGDSFLSVGNHGVMFRSGTLGGLGSQGVYPTITLHPPGEENASGKEAAPVQRRPRRPMAGSGDTNVHHFEAIGYVPTQGIELTLGGAIPSGFSADYDLFPVEISDNLVNWMPWQTFLRTNRLGRPFSPWDTSVGETPYRFYRTFTNQFPTVILRPTGPHAVGRTVRWVELATHSVRRGFRVFVWYPARAQGGQVPMRYFEAKLAGNIASLYGGSAPVFQAACAHGTQDVEFAAGLTACPVVLCSPGWGNPGTDSTDKAEDLASHGFVVVGLEHADPSYSLQPDLAGAVGTPYEPFAALLISRVKDAHGVLEQLDRWNREDGLLAGRLDPDQVGMFGFSAGGATAIEVAQAHPQCKAAVNLDGGVPHDYLRSGYSKAALIIGSGEAGWDHHRVLREFVESLPKDAYFFRTSGTTHAYFGDYLWFRLKNARVGTLTKRSVTSFFNKHLRGVDDHFLDNPVSEYPEVIDFVRR